MYIFVSGVGGVQDCLPSALKGSVVSEVDKSG